MSTEEPSIQPAKTRIHGKRLGAKGVIASALLEQGTPMRTVQKLTGISSSTAVALKRQGMQELISHEHADQIRKGLRNKFALVADQILGSVSLKDIKDAPLGERLRSAGIAADRAGIGPVSHVEVYKTTLNKYEKA